MKAPFLISSLSLPVMEYPAWLDTQETNTYLLALCLHLRNIAHFLFFFASWYPLSGKPSKAPFLKIPSFSSLLPCYWCRFVILVWELLNVSLASVALVRSVQSRYPLSWHDLHSSFPSSVRRQLDMK